MIAGRSFLCHVTFPEKMNNVVGLFFVLIGSMVERSDAVSCYDCGYDSRQPESTCTLPINATVAPKCNWLTCEWIFLNYTGPNSKSAKVSRDAFC